MTDDVSSSECIAWLTVYGTEAVAIVTLNFLTIIVFIRNRSLRKLSMYLVINLAVADMLVGGFSEVVVLVDMGARCRVWRINRFGSSILDTIIRSMWSLFLWASLTNLTAISLERMHATFRPFKHRVIKQWVLNVVITVTWVTAGLLETYWQLLRWNTFNDPVLQLHVFFSFMPFCLFIIFVSYSSILVKVYCGAHPQHHRATSRERKLTKTLFMVTLASLVTWFPFLALYFISANTDISYALFSRLYNSSWVLVYANSLINPIVYTIRMPEFRRALVSLLIRRQHRQLQVQIPLQNIPFNSRRLENHQKCLKKPFL